MKIHVRATVYFPVVVDQDFEIEDPKDNIEIEEAVLDLASAMLEQSGSSGVIEGKMDINFFGKE